MKQTLAFVPIRSISPATLALGLWLGLALAACRVAAADPTNAAALAPRTAPPTGLVVPPEWKAEAPAHDYDFLNIPLTEVVRELQRQAKQQFDVLLPSVGAPHVAPGAPGVPVERMDPSALGITLRLKNVSVIEVFQAMNMLFEIDHTPVRWELVMNGHRPAAVLHVLEAELHPPGPSSSLPPEARPQAASRSVVFVGDLLGEADAGGMNPESLCGILAQTASDAFGASGTRKIQFHKGAELLILSGTDEELHFMKDVLQALKEKSNHQRKQDPGGARETSAKK